MRTRENPKFSLKSPPKTYLKCGRKRKLNPRFNKVLNGSVRTVPGDAKGADNLKAESLVKSGSNDDSCEDVVDTSRVGGIGRRDGHRIHW